MRKAVLLILALTLALTVALAAPAIAQPEQCLGGNVIGPPVSFDPTESRQSYQVEPGASAVFIVAEGASGGDAVSRDPARGDDYFGGLGAYVWAEVPAVGGQMLDVIVGERGNDGSDLDLRGGDDDEPEPIEGEGGGGGGGSFVGPAGSTTLWVAAGGGGGAGTTQDGKDASLGSNGVSSDAPCQGVGGTDGNGGGASTSDDCFPIMEQRGGSSDAGGGGGWLSAGEDGDAEGGDRVSVPGTAAGGLGTRSNHGGFGGGGGGSGPGGGGGGGYSGGGGGYGMGTDGGGGGGSFVTATGIVDRLEITKGSGDGFVYICSLTEFSGGGSARVLQVPAGGPWAKAGLAALLALAALFVIRRAL